MENMRKTKLLPRKRRMRKLRGHYCKCHIKRMENGDALCSVCGRFMGIIETLWQARV